MRCPPSQAPRSWAAKNDNSNLDIQKWLGLSFDQSDASKWGLTGPSCSWWQAQSRTLWAFLEWHSCHQLCGDQQVRSGASFRCCYFCCWCGPTRVSTALKPTVIEQTVQGKLPDFPFYWLRQLAASLGACSPLFFWRSASTPCKHLVPCLKPFVLHA